MTDTPRTDALAIPMIPDGVPEDRHHEWEYVKANFARKLERELAEARQKADLWERFVSLQSGNVNLLVKDAERYTRVRRLAIQSRLPKQWLEGWADTRLLDAAIDAAITNR